MFNFQLFTLACKMSPNFCTPLKAITKKICGINDFHQLKPSLNACSGIARPSVDGMEILALA